MKAPDFLDSINIEPYDEFNQQGDDGLTEIIAEPSYPAYPSLEDQTVIENPKIKNPDPTPVLVTETGDGTQVEIKEPAGKKNNLLMIGGVALLVYLLMKK